MASRPLNTADPIRFGEDFELDLRAYQLRRSGRPLKLERIPMELLMLLIERRGELVTREQIIERVWGKDVFLDTESGINAGIRKIRQVLKDDPERPRFVQTVTGRGYRFIASIEEPSKPPPHPALVIDNRLPSVESLLGKKISHYRVLQLLGGGGMGVVYKAEDLKLGRQVALKFLPAELARDPVAFQRLEQEARAASALDHPNICSIYQLGEHEGQPFIVMQLLEGQTLREWIAAMATRDPASQTKDLVDLAIQITNGLAAAHRKGIIHRDIKPANIFITSQGQAKILDFGVAKFMDAAASTEEHGGAEIAGESGTAPRADTHLTQTGVSFGTPSYLSPEQIRREKLDARTDLFSFGLVLYEMATGRRAFSGNTATVIRDAVLNLPVVPPQQLDPSLSPELERIITKSLEKDRDNRYQSATELSADLHRLTRPLPAAGLSLRRVGLFAAAGVTLVLVVLFAANLGGVRQRLSHRARPPESSAQFKVRPSIAVLGFKNLSGRDDEAWISTALSEMLGAELASGQQLRVIPGENVARMKLDLTLPTANSYGQDTLSKIRNHLGTDMVVLGSYLATGKNSNGKIRIDLQLQDARAGETIVVVSRDGTESDLSDLVSLGGASLRQKLGIGDVSTQQAGEVQASLPSNPKAARLYAEGLDKMRAFESEAARGLLVRAVAADPKYPLAHAALASAWSALGYDVKALEEAKRAFDLSASLSREERLAVEAQYREMTKDWPKAIEIYRALADLFPDNLNYGLRLAAAQISPGQSADALTTLATLRKLPLPTGSDPRIDLAEAKAAEHMGDFKREAQLAVTAADKGKSQNARLIVAYARSSEGWALERMGQTDRALEALAEAKLSFAAVGDLKEAANAVNKRGTVLFDKGDFEGARKQYEESLLVYRQIGAKRNARAASNNIGNVLFEEGKFAQAMTYYEDDLRLDRELGDQFAIATDLMNLANVLEALGDLAGDKKMQEQALQVFNEVGDKEGAAMVVSNLGIVLEEQGDLPGAKQRSEQAFQLYQAIGSRRGMGFALYGIAEVLINQDKLVEARQKSEQALQIRKDLADLARTASSWTQLATCALEQGNWAEAEKLAGDAARYFEDAKSADPDRVAAAYSVLARVRLAQNQLSEAAAASQRASALAGKTGGRDARFDTDIVAARVALAMGRPAEARSKLVSVVAEAKKFGYGLYQFEAKLALCEIDLKSTRTATARAQLISLEKEARARGYNLIARKAAADRDLVLSQRTSGRAAALQQTSPPPR